MDNLFDDPDDILDAYDILDPTSPIGLAFLAFGVVDDDGEDEVNARCGCWCECQRRTDSTAAVCAPCRIGRHRDAQQAR